MVAMVDLPERFKDVMSLLTGCMAGASLIKDLAGMLKDAGFEQIEIKPKDESRHFVQKWAPGTKMEDYVASASIEAIKPKA